MTRFDKLKQKLPEDFGAALVLDRYNREYLTGFGSSAGMLIITERQAFFVVDFRYYEAAKSAVSDVEVVLMSNQFKQAGDIIGELGVSKVYVESETSIGTIEKLKEKFSEQEIVCEDILSGALKELRAIKDAGEIEAIKSAQAITDAAFAHILGYIKPGVSERELAAEIEYFMCKNGADGTAFPTICVAGTKTSMPHGEPGDNTVKNGDFVTMDFGAKKNGYCSDMTRTVAVGSVSEEHKKVYGIVFDAQTAAMRAAKEGIIGKQLDAVARDIIDYNGYQGCFGHGLGHSLGLEIHEDPRAAINCETMLLDGTIMTIEPGIYLEGRFGVRIENMVCIRKDGCENLTNSERGLIVV